MSSAPTNPDLLALAAQIVSAHVRHNAVPMDTLPGVIRSVYATLSGLEAPAPEVEPPAPVVRRGGRPRAAEVAEAPVAKVGRGKRRAG